MPNEVKQALFTAAETAIILGCSGATVWRDIKAGRLEVVHIGGRTRVKGSSIDRVIAGEAPLRPPRVGPIEPKPKPELVVAEPEPKRRAARPRS